MRKLVIKNNNGDLKKGVKVKVISRYETNAVVKNWDDDEDWWLDDTVLGD